MPITQTQSYTYEFYSGPRDGQVLTVNDDRLKIGDMLQSGGEVYTFDGVKLVHTSDCQSDSISHMIDVVRPVYGKKMALAFVQGLGVGIILATILFLGFSS